MPLEKLKIPSSREGWVACMSLNPYLAGLQTHRHRELECNLVIRGHGVYFIAGGHYQMRPGTLLWLFPGQSHVLVEASTDFQMWVVVFRPRLVRRIVSVKDQEILCSEDPGDILAHPLAASACGFLDQVCRRLARIRTGEDPYFNHGLGFLLKSAWDAGRATETMPPSAQVHPAVERAVHLMHEGQLCGSLTSLCRKAGLSYSRLCTLFREQTGETLADFRNRLRVQRFYRLLKAYPERNLLDLSGEAGFGSYAQCHRMVFRYTGRKPSRLKHEQS